ncbi:MAG TPA: hypothetical protein VFT06_04120 [Flavisolibacter sp.]|nr:hypothetical protein [Flavisolibacter sp.]
MGTENQPLKIIGNESNMVYEIQPDGSAAAEKQAATTEGSNATEGPATEMWDAAATPHDSNDLATNDGTVVETLDTAFHHKPGVAEGENPSGSNRADYYEERSFGQSDAEEEVVPSPDE